MISVIIPAYNEEESIGQVIREIKDNLNKQGYQFEIMVIDDGSTDKTSEIIQKQEVRFFRHDVAMGYGLSLKQGIRESRGDIIAIIDADKTYPVESLVDLIEEIKDCDMVVGARIGPKVRIPLIRKPVKYLLNRLSSFLTGVNIPDVNSGMRVMRKEIVLGYMSLFPQGFSFTTTVTLAMLCDGYRVKFYPINYHDRQGRSKVRPIRDTFGFILTAIRTVLYFNPLKIFLPVGIIVFILALVRLLRDIVTNRNIGDMTILLFIFFFQIILLGLVADILGRK